MDTPVFAVTEEGGGVFPLAVYSEDCRFFLEAAQVISARRMRQVMLHGHEPGGFPVDAQGAPGFMYAAAIAAESAIAVQQCIERPVRGVPVASREAPAGGRRQWDGGVRESDDVHIRRIDAARGQAIARRLDGHALLCVLVPHEALFLRRGDDFPVHQQRRGRIVTQGARQAENIHSPLSSSPSAASLA